jgi:hypothetical protein
MKKQSHSFVLTVRFDRKCSRQLALREVKDTIYGEHYTSPRDDADPDSFKIRSIRPAKATQ